MGSTHRFLFTSHSSTIGHHNFATLKLFHDKFWCRPCLLADGEFSSLAFKDLDGLAVLEDISAEFVGVKECVTTSGC